MNRRQRPFGAPTPKERCKRLFHMGAGGVNPSPTKFGIPSTQRNNSEAMFRLCRNGEFVLPPKRRHFASETAKHRGFCEATSLTAFVPYDVATRPSSLPRRLDTAVLDKPKTVKHRGRTRTNRGIYKGTWSPRRTFLFNGGRQPRSQGEAGDRNFGA